MPKVKINGDSFYFFIAYRKDSDQTWQLTAPYSLDVALETMATMHQLYARSNLKLVVEVPILPIELKVAIHPLCLEE